MTEQANPTPAPEEPYDRWQQVHPMEANFAKGSKYIVNREVEAYLNDLERQLRQSADQQEAATKGMAILNGEILTLRGQLREVTAERDGWRRTAVLHGAEVQSDNEYLLSRYEPQMKENAELMETVGRLSDKLKAKEQELTALKTALNRIIEICNAGGYDPVDAIGMVAFKALNPDKSATQEVPQKPWYHRDPCPVCGSGDWSCGH